MNDFLKLYAKILHAYITSYYSGPDSANPTALNKRKYEARSVFISLVFFLKFGHASSKDVCKGTGKWLSACFGFDNLLSKMMKGASKDLISLINRESFNHLDFRDIDVSSLYEGMLGIESTNVDDQVKISTAKNYRNKLGSYYTPTSLAESVTRKTMDTYFKLNLGIHNLAGISQCITRTEKRAILRSISESTIADFSCGGGRFFLEVLDYYQDVFDKLGVNEAERNKAFRDIVLNIFACDVDCTALEVAKLHLLLRINQPELYCHLDNKFVHANFLLHSDVETDISTRLDIFSSGFIYHHGLALDRKVLGRYDIILGNPPWEKIRFEDKAFYSVYSSQIATDHFKTTRNEKISASFTTNLQLGKFASQYCDEVNKAKNEIKSNAFFALANSGELNTYALFTAAAINLRSDRGVVGILLKSAITTSQVNKTLFNHLTKNNLVIEIHDFINTGKIFNIDSRERFCFLLIGTTTSNKFNVSMNLKDADDIHKKKPEIELCSKYLSLLNPITGMLPNFTTKEEAKFLIRVSSQFPFFHQIFNVRFGRIVHLTNHSDFITQEQMPDNIPIYEGKFFHQFDGKFSGFNGVPYEKRYSSKSSSVTLEDKKKKEPDYLPVSRFYIDKQKWLQLSKNHKADFMLGWRSLTSATNTRTCIATLLPFIPASQSVQFLTTREEDILFLTGMFNSCIFDYILKKKLGGIDLTQSVINQMPVPRLEEIDRVITFCSDEAPIKEFISRLVFSLLKDDTRLHSLFYRTGYTDQDVMQGSRLELIRNIDLLFMFLYDLHYEEIKLIFTAFEKQYLNQDIYWFKVELERLISDNAISPTGTSLSASGPIGRIVY